MKKQKNQEFLLDLTAATITNMENVDKAVTHTPNYSAPTTINIGYNFEGVLTPAAASPLFVLNNILIFVERKRINRKFGASTAPPITLIIIINIDTGVSRTPHAQVII